jgi:tRNA 2-thiouridine synthesizing protein B
MLFIINKSPFSSKSFQSCLRFATSNDTILFIEDGVLAVKSGETEKAEEKGITLYALKSDLKARGIESAVPTVDYEGFVDLVEKDAVATWI